MPYIKQIDRYKFEQSIQDILDLIEYDGEVNYIITRIIDSIYGGNSYDGLNTAIGVLGCIMQEFYRRRVAPYEDKKIKQNGDVYL